MLTKFRVNDKGFLAKITDASKECIWIDVLNPSHEERQHIEQDYQVSLPMHNEMHQLEFSNRFYQENDSLYFSLHVVTKASPIPESHVITFILKKNILVSLRYSEPNPIEDLGNQIERKQFFAKDPFDVFKLLLNKIVGTVADIFELIDENAEEISLFLVGTSKLETSNGQNAKLNQTLLDINYLEALLGKCFQSLASLRLLFTFFDEIEDDMLSKESCQRLAVMTNDIEALYKHAEHLTQKFNFQLQSTLGLINVEQTQIIKIFTVLAMIFMPPTLIASIYGMNFHFMPELNFKYGYFCTLIAMFITAICPYLMFKKRGWI